MPDFAGIRADDSRSAAALALLDEDEWRFALCDDLIRVESAPSQVSGGRSDPPQPGSGQACPAKCYGPRPRDDRVTPLAGMDAPCLIEVEIPDSPPPEMANRSLRTRRIAFYERHGALITASPIRGLPGPAPEQPDRARCCCPVAPGQAAPGGACSTGAQPGGRSGPRACMVEGYGADPMRLVPRNTWTGSRTDRACLEMQLPVTVTPPAKASVQRTWLWIPASREGQNGRYSFPDPQRFRDAHGAML